jgi:protein-S-isoprenylcysteine O-methyltransferase Ste14
MESGMESRMKAWRAVARRIRVPLGFAAALVYLWQLVERRPAPAAMAWSLLLVLPGLWLRGYAAGYVQKNSALTVTGPYAHVRNPLYLGSILISAGFAVALGSWAFWVALAAFFLLIYVPVIASEEAFLRQHFAEFDWYAAHVPRLIPRLTPFRSPVGLAGGGFSLARYRKHREYNAAIGAALLYLSLILASLLVAAHGSLHF